MSAAVERLRVDLTGIKSGVVRPALLESVRVEAYGSLVPISHVATVSGGPKARTLQVTPFDPGLLVHINRAIQSANLGLNPQVGGTSILVSVPAPDEDQKKKLISRAKSLSEQQKTAVRNVRKDARNVAKRDGRLSSRVEDEISRLTEKSIAEIDALLQGKIDEIGWLDPRWNR